MSFDATLCLNTVLPLAQAAYNPALMPAGWEIVAAIQPDDFGYIVRQVTPDRVRVAIIIPGTRDLAQWFEDFDALVVPAVFGGPGHVHQGFQRQYAAIRESILAGFALVGAFDQLWIVGHSLGAALAILTAAELSAHEPTVWTFEGPRAGWFDFAHWFDQVITNCWRVENIRDIVPHVPNELFGYRHVGTGIPIDGGHTDSLRIAHGFDPSVKTGLTKLITV